MSSQQSQLSFIYSKPNGEIIQESQVDAWELKASRRALKNLKTLLAGQPMLDLLKDQMDEADVFLKEIIEKSNGEFKESRVDLQAKGITSAQFTAWWKVWLEESYNPQTKQQNFIDTYIPAHPEHYTIPTQGAGIVETIGGRIARVSITPCLIPPDEVLAYTDPTFQQMCATGASEDGTVAAYVLHELRDSEEGCDFHLQILFPAASPQILIDEHAEHLAVEFRSFISTAFAWNQKQAATN